MDPPTLICLGFQWHFEGDDNRNAACGIEYRKTGEGAWSRGMPLLRVEGEEPKEDGWYQRPMFAGSLLDLDEGTDYEVRLTVSDPDGVEGDARRTLTVRTRAMPAPVAGGEVRHVYPPRPRNKKQPEFNSIAAALRGKNLGAHDAGKLPTENAAPPGTTVLVHAGTYKPDRYRYRDPSGMVLFGSNVLSADGTREKPIVIKAAGDGKVVLDFAGNHCGFNVMGADWLVFDGLTVRNTDIAFLAGMWNTTGCVGLTVRNCRIEDVNSGVVGFHGRCREFIIADNVFTGRYTQDEKVGEGAPMVSMYGVNLCGGGHVVCHNRLSRFFDVIDVWTEGTRDPSFRCWAFDIYNNDIDFSPDNAIEADGGYTNIRILRNRCFNSGGPALSNQRPTPGPVYWIRNVVVNGHAFKNVVGASGLRIYHNTIACNPAMCLRANHTEYLNNLFMASRAGASRRCGPGMKMGFGTADCRLDYNGHRVAPGDTAVFRVENRAARSGEAATLTDLAAKTGYAAHSVTVPDYGIFRGVAREPFGPRGSLFRPENYDFRLKPDAPPVDAGVVIPNVNNNCTGEAPDLGAYEVGRPTPHYGPRTQAK
ncbi:MAG: hypothetical protein R6X20_02910 [Phycisphaerae bacterium]